MLTTILVALVVVAVMLLAAAVYRQVKLEPSLCAKAVDNILLPAALNGQQTTVAVPCCTDGEGNCLESVGSRLQSVTLVPEKLSKSCPPLLLAEKDYGPHITGRRDNIPGTADVTALGALYATPNCGAVQVALTRVCEAGKAQPTGECKGGITVAASADPGKNYISLDGSGVLASEAGVTADAVCGAGGLLQVTRKVVAPNNLRLNCPRAELQLGGATEKVLADPIGDSSTADLCGDGTPSVEYVFYQCLT